MCMTLFFTYICTSYTSYPNFPLLYFHPLLTFLLFQRHIWIQPHNLLLSPLSLTLLRQQAQVCPTSHGIYHRLENFRVKNSSCKNFSWFKIFAACLICEVLLTVDGYNMDIRLELSKHVLQE